MRPILTLAAALALPAGMALAAGSDSSDPPETTETTTQCEDGMVWDASTEQCVEAESRLLDDDARYAAVRELAYAGRTREAQAVLATMADQDAGRVLTYWGFTHRRLGDSDTAMRYYRAALETEPDNLLARSYMGQGLVTEGKTEAARAQLTQIRARGGTGSWPEKALVAALETGASYSY